MSYVNYTPSLYRNGYRPVGETNPFAATHLGLAGSPFRPDTLRGIDGRHHQRHVDGRGNQFEPAEMPVAIYRPGHYGYESALGYVDPRGNFVEPVEMPVAMYRPNSYGFSALGQGKPFTPAGGYMLHGLGAIVPDQSVVNYSGTWSGTWDMTPQDVIDAVTTALPADGLMVRSVSSSAGMVANTKVFDLAGGNQTFQVSMQLQVNNGQGYGDPNDIISIINHEVYVATGAMPVGGSIPTVQAPGTAAPVATGQPAVPGAPALPGVPTDWASWLEQNALWIGLGLAAVVLGPALVSKL